MENYHDKRYFTNIFITRWNCKQRSVVCDCTHEEKMNVECFAQNGSNGNQSRTLLRSYFIVHIALMPAVPVLSRLIPKLNYLNHL